MSAPCIALLRALADGGTHSSAVLAQRTSCARATVRKALATLRAQGVEVEAIRGSGYRLAAPYAALDAKKLFPLLKPPVDLELRGEIDSTNAYLLGEIAAGAARAKSGRACIAEIQTCGRGRRGRTWFAVPGASLAFSMLWRFEQPLNFLAGLSLAAGIAVVRVLRCIGARDVRLKWPNDVVHHHRKLAGILVETQGGNAGPSVAVIGIGINLRLPRAVRERIEQAVTDVAEASGTEQERNAVAAMLLNELATVLKEFSRSGFAGLRDEWAELHAYQGQAVRMTRSGSEQVTGRVTGVAADGALLIATGSGEQRFYSGEISLRAA